MTRKIIQIAISSVPSCPGEHGWWDNLYALCDDGSLWMKDCPAQVDDAAPKWKRIANVPQDDEPINF